MIHTERCILNRPEASDRGDVFRLRTDPDVRRFLGGPAEEATFDYHRIVAETQAANLPSRRLLERLGMQLTGSAVRYGEEQAIYSTSDS